ncbi:MAG: GNAT family N-acetyltransferase [Actinomycetota bacterium]
MIDPAAEFQRALDFTHAMEERSYTRKGPWRYGTAYFHDGFPVKWALNFLRAEGDISGVTASELAEDAHRVQGGAGLNHRKINVDEQETGDRLEPQFKELEWLVQRLLFMALREPPSERPDVPVTLLSNDEIRPFRLAAEMTEHRNSPEDARRLTESMVVTAHATNMRNIVGSIDGEVAGWGEFYSDGRTAQIENIGTFERFRNRGVARAVVLKAIELATAEGHDFFFLIADANDWPKELYKKLGFEEIGHTYEFMLRGD